MGWLPDSAQLVAEADGFGEPALQYQMAQGWRDIASGYRMLAEFVAAGPIDAIEGKTFNSQ